MKCKKKRKKKKVLKRLLKIFISLILLLLIAFIIIFHSPYTKLKELWVTTAMSTMNHQYLAHLFVSDKEIDEIMQKNKVIESKEKINLDNIQISKASSSGKIFEALHDSTIEKIDINENGYRGYLLIVHDPSRIFVGVSNKLGSYGEMLPDMVKDYKAVGGINGGGFSDPDWEGNGGLADNLVISQSKILVPPKSSVVSLVGFTNEDKLVIGSYSMEEINAMGVRDAVVFYPALIINGTPTKILGDGGWGIQPRTAIGQRKDGSVLLLAIDGRQIGSLGITIKTLQDIMIRYGAENAANLDGGASTSMAYDGKMINHPCSNIISRHIPDAFLIREPITMNTFIKENLKELMPY